MNMGLLVLAPIAGIIGLLYAAYLALMVNKADAGNETMKRISGYIYEGAMAFLAREYKSLAVFIISVSIVICLLLNFETAAAFIGGALFSILTGFFGMKTATRANVRCA
ncbi:MAG TPA: sodium-translocating pyrophosphatase, partial [Clostridiaceae bacterium]|nr:sodium-translocating pyrophosphatase [Clostridiaceae bacterium]